MDLFSLFIYSLTFICSCLFIYLSQIEDFRHRLSGNLFAFIGILFPCVLAALRDFSVGTDNQVYILPNITNVDDLIERGFVYYYEHMPLQTEIGYAVLLYLGNIIDIGVTYFLNEFLIITPVYIVLCKYRKVTSVTLGMAVFYMLNYNMSLSLMRGSIAMSFVLLAFYYLQIKSIKKVVLLIGSAFLFHTSAVLMFAIIVMSKKMLESKYKKEYLCLGIFISACLFLFANQLMEVMAGIAGFVNPRYAFYLIKYIGTGSIKDIPITDFLCKSFLILISVVVFVRSNMITSSRKYFILLCMIGRFFVLFNSIFYESMRLAFYFDMFLILLVASSIKCFKRDDFYNIVSIFILIPAMGYWLYFIMGKIGAYGTNVYSFRF